MVDFLERIFLLKKRYTIARNTEFFIYLTKELSNLSVYLIFDTFIRVDDDLHKNKAFIIFGYIEYSSFLCIQIYYVFVVTELDFLVIDGGKWGGF